VIDLNFHVDTRALQKWALLKPGTKRKTLRKLAGHYMLLVRERVKKGLDVGGAPFRAYSPGYERRKRRAGRMKENYWLRLTGKMMRSQKAKYRKRGKNYQATISFEGTRPQAKFEGKGRGRIDQKQAKTGAGLTVNLAQGEMVSNAYIAAKNDDIRAFVGVNGNELEELRRLFLELIEVS